MSSKTYTGEEIREIAARQGLSAFPHLALMREKLSVKAKNEPGFRFYSLKRLVVEEETLRCAWRQVRANKGAPGIDGVTFEDIEQSEGGVDGFLAGLKKELHAKTYKARPVRRVYIEKANGRLRPPGMPVISPLLSDEFVRRVEHELEHRFGLVVNREKTKVLDMDAPKAALAFLGYEFG